MCQIRCKAREVTYFPSSKWHIQKREENVVMCPYGALVQLFTHHINCSISFSIRKSGKAVSLTKKYTEKTIYKNLKCKGIDKIDEYKRSINKKGQYTQCNVFYSKVQKKISLMSDYCKIMSHFFTLSLNSEWTYIYWKLI